VIPITLKGNRRSAGVVGSITRWGGLTSSEVLVLVEEILDRNPLFGRTSAAADRDGRSVQVGGRKDFGEPLPTGRGSASTRSTRSSRWTQAMSPSRV
jgi:hypothetical protein